MATPPTTLCRRADDEESRKFSVVHEAVARTETGSAITHGRNDIEDVRAHTPYIENWGLVRVPTLVLFRRGARGSSRGRARPSNFRASRRSRSGCGRSRRTTPSGRSARTRSSSSLVRTSTRTRRCGERIARRKRHPRPSLAAAEKAAADQPDFTEEAEEARKRRVAEDLHGLSDEPGPSKNPWDKKFAPLGRDGRPVPLAEVDDAGGAPTGEDGGDEEERPEPEESEDDVRVACAELSKLPTLTDESFTQVVLRQSSTDVMVLFYRPSLRFCSTPAPPMPTLARRS